MRLWACGMVALCVTGGAWAAPGASNIAPADTRGVIAPRLPAPPSGRDAAPLRYLTDARDALRRHRTGEAQEALERAETRLLDRGDPNATDRGHTAVLLQAATEARQALARRDEARALAALDRVLTGGARPREVGGEQARPAPQTQAQGQWVWNGVQWVWYPAAGVQWIPPHWEWRFGEWVLVSGAWR